MRIGQVVIFEDDVSSADSLLELLEEEGYSAVRIGGTSQVLGTVADARPNLILLDTHLEQIQTFDLLEDLKRSPQL